MNDEGVILTVEAPIEDSHVTDEFQSSSSRSAL